MMNPDRLVASPGVRFATVVSIGLCVTGAVLYAFDLTSTASGMLLVLAVGSGILALVGMIHSFRVVYTRWMRFAQVLHTAVVTLLFGACYLFVVPVFFLMVWPFDLLRLRKRSSQHTFWHRRRSVKVDADSLTRMG